MIHVEKADGSLQPYDREKVRRLAVNMGVAPSDVEAVVQEVEERIYDGIPTRRLLAIVKKTAQKYKPSIEYLTNLRRAIALLRPKPDFERYVQIVLRENGYEVDDGRILKGRCGEHEVDAIARKGGVTYFVEVKHHYSHHRMTGLDEGRIARAIVEDIQEGHKAGKNSFTIDKAMIVCNTKLTNHAKRYADCWGIEHIGWNHPADENLETMIQRSKLYPVSIIKGVTPAIRTSLFRADIITVPQLARMNPADVARRANLPEHKAAILVERARALLNSGSLH
jgi:hypothetical protein